MFLEIIYNLVKSNLEENSKRTFRKNMEPKYLRPNDTLSPLAENGIYKYLPAEFGSGNDAFKFHFNQLINFAEFFEKIQLDMLRHELEPKEIVFLFSEHTAIKSTFYKDLYAFLR